MDNKAVAKRSPTGTINVDAISRALMHGDLSKLSDDQKLSYYKNLCESVGLNPLSKPFEYMKLQGKEILYAGKTCAEQLRELHNVSVKITSRDKFEDIYVVSAQATLPDGRHDESTGAVNVGNLRGEGLANAYMKAETKAKRRVTLSIIGLGILDESEVESIKEAQKQVAEIVPQETNQKQIIPPGEFVINFTKGFKGKKIKELEKANLEQLTKWCIEKNTMHEFIAAAEAYLKVIEGDIEPDLPNFDEFPG